MSYGVPLRAGASPDPGMAGRHMAERGGASRQMVVHKPERLPDTIGNISLANAAGYAGMARSRDLFQHLPSDAACRTRVFASLRQNWRYVLSGCHLPAGVAFNSPLPVLLCLGRNSQNNLFHTFESIHCLHCCPAPCLAYPWFAACLPCFVPTEQQCRTRRNDQDLATPAIPRHHFASRLARPAGSPPCYSDYYTWRTRAVTCFCLYYALPTRAPHCPPACACCCTRTTPTHTGCYRAYTRGQPSRFCSLATYLLSPPGPHSLVFFGLLHIACHHHCLLPHARPPHATHATLPAARTGLLSARA